MKDVSGILQFPFIAESDKKFSACNINIMNGLPYILKDEGSFCKTPM